MLCVRGSSNPGWSDMAVFVCLRLYRMSLKIHQYIFSFTLFFSSIYFLTHTKIQSWCQKNEATVKLQHNKRNQGHISDLSLLSLAEPNTKLRQGSLGDTAPRNEFPRALNSPEKGGQGNGEFLQHTLLSWFSPNLSDNISLMSLLIKRWSVPVLGPLVFLVHSISLAELVHSYRAVSTYIYIQQ